MTYEIERDLTYSPMGKWGASYTGRAIMRPTGGGLQMGWGFEWIGPVTKSPARRWRRVIRWAILNHWWAMKYRLRGEA